MLGKSASVRNRAAGFKGEASGGVDLEAIRKAAQQAAESQKVRGCLLHPAGSGVKRGVQLVTSWWLATVHLAAGRQRAMSAVGHV